MLDLWNKALVCCEKAIGYADTDKKDEARRLEALGHFIRNSVITVMNIKKWWQLNMAMQNSATAEEAESYLDKIEALAHAEIKNAEETIPVVEFDSRLGWEPSMEYIGDAFHLRWKIRQMTQVIENELSAYQKVIDATENS